MLEPRPINDADNFRVLRVAARGETTNLHGKALNFYRFDYPRSALSLGSWITFEKIKLRKSPRTNFEFCQRVHLIRFTAGVKLRRLDLVKRYAPRRICEDRHEIGRISHAFGEFERHGFKGIRDDLFIALVLVQEFCEAFLGFAHRARNASEWAVMCFHFPNVNGCNLHHFSHCSQKRFHAMSGSGRG